MKIKTLDLFFGALGLFALSALFLYKIDKDAYESQRHSGVGLIIMSITDKEMDAWNYYKDSIVFAHNKYAALQYDSTNAKIYFVRYPKTPDYFAADTIKDETWDGHIFWGYKKGGYVYYRDVYHPKSQKFIEEFGDTTIVVEKMFDTASVHRDPRYTTWWITNMLYPPIACDKSIDSLLNRLLLTQGETGFEEYFTFIKNEIYKSKGESNMEKLSNYTREAAPGYDSFTLPNTQQYDASSDDEDDEYKTL